MAHQPSTDPALLAEISARLGVSVQRLEVAVQAAGRFTKEEFIHRHRNVILAAMNEEEA